MNNQSDGPRPATTNVVPYESFVSVVFLFFRVCIWVINVEARAARCRMANMTIILTIHRLMPLEPEIQWLPQKCYLVQQCGAPYNIRSRRQRLFCGICHALGNG